MPEHRRYTCPYPNCHCVFERIIHKYDKPGSSKGQQGSDNVMCPKCKNLLKVRNNSISEVIDTWD